MRRRRHAARFILHSAKHAAEPAASLQEEMLNVCIFEKRPWRNT